MAAVKFIEIIRAFYDTGGTGDIPWGTQIRPIRHWKKLVRTWNGGCGQIDFAIIVDGVLVVNALFLEGNESGQLRNSGIPVAFVELGYPSYYRKGLATMYREQLES